jgi:hypothetical protein
MTMRDALCHAIEVLRERGQPKDNQAAKILEKRAETLRLKRETRAASNEHAAEYFANLPLTLSRSLVIEAYRSTECVCGLPKPANVAVCPQHCWPRVSATNRAATHYTQFGNGLEQVYEACLLELGLHPDFPTNKGIQA